MAELTPPGRRTTFTSSRGRLATYVARPRRITDECVHRRRQASADQIGGSPPRACYFRARRHSGNGSHNRNPRAEFISTRACSGERRGTSRLDERQLYSLNLPHVQAASGGRLGRHETDSIGGIGMSAELFWRRAARRANRAPMRSSTQQKWVCMDSRKPKTDHCRVSQCDRETKSYRSEKPRLCVWDVVYP